MERKVSRKELVQIVNESKEEILIQVEFGEEEENAKKESV